MLLVYQRFCLALLLGFTETMGLYHTSLALAVGAMATVMGDGAVQRRGGTGLGAVLSIAADFAFVAVAFSVLTLRVHTPAYLPIAASVSFAVYCVSCYGGRRVVRHPLGRFTALVCLWFLIMLYGLRVRNQVGYVQLLNYGPHVVAAFLTATTAETVGLALAARGQARTGAISNTVTTCHE